MGILAALLRSGPSFSLALGDALIIEAIALFGIAWVGYLKKDGVRFLPPGKSLRAGPAESWKDRVPSPGEIPSPPRTIPGPEGPDNADYQRLAAAEERLRKKIMGAETESEGEKKTAATDAGFVRSAALAGALLFVLGLCFEYLIPAVPRR